MIVSAGIKPAYALLLVLVLHSFLPSVWSQPFARICAINELAPVYPVTYNEESGEYGFVLGLDDIVENPVVNMTNNNNNNRELILRRSVSSAAAQNSIRITQQLNFTTTASSSFEEGGPYDLYDILMVRECPCARDTYCRWDLDTCGVPVDYSQPVGCFAKSTKKTLLRNAWPLLLLWYSTILFFLMCTEKGRNARNFMLLKVCKSNNNERIVDRFLYTHGFISTNPFVAGGGAGQNNNNMRDPSQSPIDWLPIARPVEPREPTELVLKTRIFKPPDNVENLEEEDTTCTICFAALEDGDRVGKLSCSHTFHVDCLREWLPRRNVCPLCQTSNAATPRYGDNNREEEGDNNNNNNTTTGAAAEAGEGPTTQEANDADDNIEMARIDNTVVEVEDTRVAQLRRPNPNFAQQLLAATRF